MTLFSWTGFTHYSLWGLQFLFVFPRLPITLAIGGNLAAAVAITFRKIRAGWKTIYWLVFANFLFYPITIVIAAIGTVDASGNYPTTQNSVAIWLCNGCILLSIAYGAFWVWRMKGLRWFAVSVLLTCVWVLLGAEFVAGMALSGPWL